MCEVLFCLPGPVCISSVQYLKMNERPLADSPDYMHLTGTSIALGGVFAYSQVKRLGKAKKA